VKLHHVGIVTDKIERRAAAYNQLLGVVPASEITVDDIQRVRVQFLGCTDDVQIELIEPLDGESPARRALEKGGGLNHVCFEVQNVAIAVEEAVKKGAICVCPPVSASAMDGRLISFVFFRELGLIEFVEPAADKGAICGDG